LAFVGEGKFREQEPPMLWRQHAPAGCHGGGSDDEVVCTTRLTSAFHMSEQSGVGAGGAMPDFGRRRAQQLRSKRMPSVASSSGFVEVVHGIRAGNVRLARQGPRRRVS
jgi:hypothetical protein